MDSRIAIDRSPLVHGESEPLPEKPYPVDGKAAACLANERALCWLGKSLARGARAPVHRQDEGVATYFPRLDSAIHA